MSETKYPTAELSALFIAKSFGSKPQFRGLHAVTGDLTKNDGARTPVYNYLAGQPIRVTNQRGDPEDVTVSIDGPLQSIADLVGTPQECPVDILLVIDNCLSPQQKRSWGRWGSTSPQMFILMPDAQIEQRTMSNLATREGQSSMVMGGIQAKFDDWKIIAGNKSATLTTVVAATTTVDVATTHCTGCLDANCGGVAGCSVWYTAAANGEVWKSIDGGSNWADVTPTTEWTNGTCIYADQLIILAGGNDGAADDYGVKRSTDGGATWSEVVFATAGEGVTGAVNQIIRVQDDLLAFASTGIWRSTDDGSSWSSVDANTGFVRGIVDENGFGVAVNLAKVFYTTDGGVRWAELTTDPGAALKGVALAGGYVHVVDSTTGYFRSTIPAVKQNDAVWEEMDDTAGVTDILFCSRAMGYRLRGTVLERTITGGYSWEVVSVGGSAPTFVKMATCGGRLAVAGGVYFAYFNPYFDTSTYVGAGSDCGC
jgi:peptidoglycan hydrolase-like protein with peptidoglycan-binding domain